MTGSLLTFPTVSEKLELTHISNKRNISCGVPQGSFLSFISATYINALISLTFNFFPSAPTNLIPDQSLINDIYPQSLRSLKSLAIINGELKSVTN